MGIHIESRQLPDDIEDFSVVSPDLRVILYPGKQWDIKNIALLHAVPNVCSSVVIDTPEMVIWLPRTQLAIWKKDLPEVFDLALDNTIKAANPERTEYPYRETELISLTGDLFTATLILNLQNITGALGKYGSLVTMYGQSRLLIYVIKDENVIQDLKYFVFMHIDILKDEKKEAIVSPAVFWYSDNGLREVKYWITKKREVKCKIPKELKKTLKKK
jgi:hypothetical protein